MLMTVGVGDPSTLAVTRPSESNVIVVATAGTSASWGCPEDSAAARAWASWKGAGSMLANEFHAQAQARGFTDVIHALMHESNLSALHSDKTGGKVFRRYALWGGAL